MCFNTALMIKLQTMNKLSFEVATNVLHAHGNSRSVDVTSMPK